VQSSSQRSLVPHDNVVQALATVEGDLPLVGGPSGITTLKSGGSAAYVGGRMIPLKETDSRR
jgi:hypothetical protein